MLLASQLSNTRRYSSYRDTHPLPTALTAEQISTFSELPGVSSTDIRYMTAGNINDLKRVVSFGFYTVKYDYTTRFVIEGTITGCTPGSWAGNNTNQINLSDCKLLAGNLPITEGGDASVIAFAEEESDHGCTGGSMHFFLCSL